MTILIVSFLLIKAIENVFIQSKHVIIFCFYSTTLFDIIVIKVVLQKIICLPQDIRNLMRALWFLRKLFKV